jgi:hypothetical protein
MKTADRTVSDSMEPLVYRMTLLALAMSMACCCQWSLAAGSFDSGRTSVEMRVAIHDGDAVME